LLVAKPFVFGQFAIVFGPLFTVEIETRLGRGQWRIENCELRMGRIGRGKSLVSGLLSLMAAFSVILHCKFSILSCRHILNSQLSILNWSRFGEGGQRDDVPVFAAVFHVF